MENGLKWLWVNCSGRHCVSGIHYQIVGMWCVLQRNILEMCSFVTSLSVCLSALSREVLNKFFFIKFLPANFY